MKFTRKQLKKLIVKELRSSQSVLLEMPGRDGSYSYGEEDNRGGNDVVDLTAQKLYHLARQADQLHDILKGDDKLSEEVSNDIEEIANKVKEIFDAVMYDKQNPKGR